MELYSIDMFGCKILKKPLDVADILIFFKL